MKIASITKLKHGDIYQLLKELNWTQAKLGEVTGMRPDQIGKVVNLQYRPSLRVMLKIQKAFGDAGKFLDVEKAWPENFLGTKNRKAIKIEKEIEVNSEFLLEFTQDLLLENQPLSPEKNEDYSNLKSASEKVLNKREQEILDARFTDNKTYEQIEKDFNVSRGRVQQIEGCALRKLKREFNHLQYLEDNNLLNYKTLASTYYPNPIRKY